MFEGTTPFVVYLVLKKPLIKLADEADVIDQVFSAFPHYLLSKSIFNFNKRNTANRLCARTSKSVNSILNSSSFTFDGKTSWEKSPCG